MLAGGGALLAALAGCTGGSGPDGGDGEDQSGGDGTDGEGSDGTDGDAPDDGDDTDGGDDGDPAEDDDGDAPDDGEDGDGTNGATADLDLREANVTAVSLSASGGEYRVSTTLIHDDDGEAGYANWWQVETLDGDRLGRRDLAHPHGTRAFTRSTTVAIDAERVVVRGHDQTHGYGGQAAIVSVPDGEVTLVRQGAEPESFADR